MILFDYIQDLLTKQRRQESLGLSIQFDILGELEFRRIYGNSIETLKTDFEG